MEDTLNVSLNGEGESTPVEMMLEFTRVLAEALSTRELSGITFHYDAETCIVVIEGEQALLQRIDALVSTAPDVWTEWEQL